MLIVMVSMRVRAGEQARFLAAIERQAGLSLRTEPGCLRFDVLRMIDDPAAYLLYEIYVDEPAFFEAHRATPHFAEWAAIAAEVLDGERVTRLATPVVPHLIAEAGHA